MPEYHRVKGDMPSLEFFKHPEKAARATLDAQRILGVDAAIMFADLLPIRKLFIDKKISCYSLDNTRGKHGQYCALCRQRFRCQQKLRLMILVHNIEQKPIPAIFEIDQRSFDSLEEVIQKIEKEKLFDTLMVIQVIHNEKKRTAIEFSPKY